MKEPQKRYVAGWECVECKKPLSWRQKMNSHGICPFCGHSSGDTICDVTQKSVAVARGPSIWARIRAFLDALWGEP